jgi:hypothetical protein
MLITSKVNMIIEKGENMPKEAQKTFEQGSGQDKRIR